LRLQSGICVFLFFALFMGMGQPVLSQNSVLSSGKWYKVSVSKNGIYKIDASQFKKMGFDLSKTDPRKVKIYGNAGGMLPQPNSTARPLDLTENAIYVQGESDGVFNSSDYIIFYGQGADLSYFDGAREIFYYEKNLYADKNYYFITVGDTNGKRVGLSENVAGSSPLINQFENFAYYELDQHNELKSGRDWFGEQFDFTTELTKSFTLSNVLSGSSIKLVTDVMAKSFGGSSFNVSINGTQVIQQNVLPIPNTQYGIKGRDKRDTVLINADVVSATSRSTQEVKYQYVKSPSGTSIGYLDYFLLQVTQKLALYGQQTIFRSSASLQQDVSTFEVDQTTSQTVVWDITNPYEPRVQKAVYNDGKTTFATATSTLKEFVIFGSGVSTPDLAGAVGNQNIKGGATPAFIIVTHPDFEAEALRLAAHRNSVSNLSTSVFTTEEVYNEFSSGRQDVTAIRDLAKYFYNKSPGTLKALLLMGKGSYDYKNRIVDNKNYIPMYESRNSLHPLLTYSSDDYLAFLEDNEGNWGEEPAVNHTMDISVGRVPVKSLTEAKNVVDKIIQYDTDLKSFGRWRKDMVFVADDGDFNLHQDDANDLAESVESAQPQFNIKKIYLDNFEQISKPSGKISPATNEQIENAFNRGSLVINYTGHGGERVWAQEKIFDDLLIERLENKKLPLLVTATCEFGRQDDPVFISGAELCMLRKDAGAIALVSTSRPVNAATNFLLNQAFYSAFFQKEDNRYLSLGEIFRRTKNTSLSGVSNRNFSLIGDPSLRLAMPDYNIEVTEIKTAFGETTLKALSTVTVKGRITGSENEIISDFNGILDAILFDKKTSFVTRGDENQPYTYSQWFNSLFRGKASVSNGEFEFHFVVPKNIAYTIGTGKLSLYAFDEENRLEASGYSKDFTVGTSEPNPVADEESPIISLYIGDTTFKNGGIANPNTNLIAQLEDENGINISGYGIGNSIIGILDDGQTFVLNDFYEADLDDFTKGSISFPLSDLAPGKHAITVKAWDTHNNPVQGTINFVVSDGETLTIESFGNYPNPVQNETTLFFTHNRSGDDLQASLVLYDYNGQAVSSYEFDLPISNYEVNLLELSRHSPIFKNHSGAIYFARLVVRSLSNGSKNERVTKLIFSN